MCGSPKCMHAGRGAGAPHAFMGALHELFGWFSPVPMDRPAQSSMAEEGSEAEGPVPKAVTEPKAVESALTLGTTTGL